jgi:hypothetical protein
MRAKTNKKTQKRKRFVRDATKHYKSVKKGVKVREREKGQ